MSRRPITDLASTRPIPAVILRIRLVREATSRARSLVRQRGAIAHDAEGVEADPFHRDRAHMYMENAL